MHSLSLTPPSPWYSGNFFNLFSRRDGSEKIKVIENSTTYFVMVTLPGFIKDDIHIRYSDGVLKIHASAPRMTLGSPGATQFAAKRQFYKSISLTKPVDDRLITYLYEENVLKIWLPKKSKFPMKGRLGLLKRFLKNF